MKKQCTDHAIKDVYRAAALRYNPWLLTNYLKKNGTVWVVDKDLAIQSAEDKSLFAVTMNSTYGWDYETDFSSVSIYFCFSGMTLIGGIYNVKTNQSLTHQIVASTVTSEQQRLDDYKGLGLNSNIYTRGVGFTPYIYTEERMLEIINRMAQMS